MRRFLFPMAALLTPGSLSCGGSKDNAAPTPKRAITWFVFQASVLVGVAIGCGSSNKPEGARGETPVRYVICAYGGSGCSVYARFKNLSDCESARQFFDGYCDRVSTPGKIICDVSQRSRISESYCTA